VSTFTAPLETLHVPAAEFLHRHRTQGGDLLLTVQVHVALRPAFADGHHASGGLASVLWLLISHHTEPRFAEAQGRFRWIPRVLR
jgi:hypothetical protein